MPAVVIPPKFLKVLQGVFKKFMFRGKMVEQIRTKGDGIDVESMDAIPLRLQQPQPFSTFIQPPPHILVFENARTEFCVRIIFGVVELHYDIQWKATAPRKARGCKRRIVSINRDGTPELRGGKEDGPPSRANVGQRYGKT